MKSKTRYTDEPMGSPRLVADFLPEPRDLAYREESVKVTMGLSKRSVQFFKQQARKHRTHYQKMIRMLVDRYAALYQEHTPADSSSRRGGPRE
ncbi:MAG: CopG family transcriptional regulator [Nitrospirae bacterium]|nr:CopG family transcriptional regulator [Nitrospirota bacterium]